MTSHDFFRPLLSVFFVVAVAFFITGLSLPVIPLHIHHNLNLDEWVVGIIVGSQFVAALIARPWAGHFADRKGPKRATILGLLVTVLAGLFYLCSLFFVNVPYLSAFILLLGRGLLGAAESLLITGAMSWGLARVQAGNAGRVIAWVGMAMFIAMGVGAPAGALVFDSGGFFAVSWVTVLLPLGAIGLMIFLSDVEITSHELVGFISIAKKVWVPGLAAALSSVGYGVILAFSTLYFSVQNWHPVWLAFAGYVMGLIIARVTLGHLPDYLGGAKTALIFILIEVAGLLLLGLGGSMILATVGSVLTGFGYALVYPGLGAEALVLTPPQSRGMTMGIFTAFLDLALAAGSIGLGFVANHNGLEVVFLVSAVLVFCAVPLTLRVTKLG